MINRDFQCEAHGVFEDLVPSSAKVATCLDCGATCPIVFVTAPAAKITASSSPSSKKARSLRDVADEKIAKANAKARKPTEDEKRDRHQRARANLAGDLVKHGNGRVTEKKAATIANSVAQTAVNRQADPRAGA